MAESEWWIVSKVLKLKKKSSLLKRRVERGRNQIGNLEIQKCVSFLGRNGGLQESENRKQKYQIFDIFCDILLPNIYK